MVRTSLSADSLRWALLAALGVPSLVACGGSVADDGGETSTGGSATGGTDGATGGTSSGGTSSGGSTNTLCTSPTPLLDDPATGFVVCAEGYKHRPNVGVCPSSLPRPAPSPAPPTGGAGGATSDECQADADCAGEHAYCTTVEQGFGLEYKACRNGCTTDDDCAEGTICRCGDPIGVCVAASCKTDDDCGEGSLCLGALNSTGCGSSEFFACKQASDECVLNDDCEADTFCGQLDGTRTCQSLNVCGRPFLVDFLERRATVELRSDWLEGDPNDESALSADDRARLAAHWADVGTMEHASIAAFARFTLQLLALGAPAELVQASIAAADDEARHARLAFALASRFAGRDLGPGALSIERALERNDVETILRTVILEGCIGETQAALEAAAAHDGARLTSVRDALRTIQSDEARHAELAWRFVAWLLETRPELRDCFETTILASRPEAPATAIAPATEPAPANGLGLLDDADRARIREETWSSVVLPCAMRLLRSTERRAPARVSLRA